MENYKKFQRKLIFSTVDAYNESLTRSILEDLSEARYDIGAASIGDYALFAGGYHSYVVDAYDSTLIHSNPTSLMSATAPPACANSGYAIFYGDDQVTAYDKNLVRTTMATDIEARGPAVRAGNYVLFRGADNMIAFDLFLTKTMAEGSGVSLYRADFAATTVNDLAVMGGDQADIIMYDPFLVKTTADIFHTPRHSLAATTLDNYAIFGGGENSAGPFRTVDIYQYV